MAFLDSLNDDDSFVVEGKEIRLWGIGAPEGRQRCKRVEVSYDCGEDSYGRTVARCFTGGVDLEGWAFDYGRYSKGHYPKD